MTKRAAHETAELAKSLRSHNLYHLFVKEESSQGVDKILKENIESSFEDNIESIDFDNLYKDEEQTITNMLRSKMDPDSKLLTENKVCYEPMIRYGEPIEQIKKTVDEKNTDIVVIGGRPQSIFRIFHPSHFSIVDQINLDRILMIIPSEQDDFEGDNRVAAA